MEFLCNAYRKLVTYMWPSKSLEPHSAQETQPLDPRVKEYDELPGASLDKIIYYYKPTGKQKEIKLS